MSQVFTLENKQLNKQTITAASKAEKAGSCPHPINKNELLADKIGPINIREIYKFVSKK